MGVKKKDIKSLRRRGLTYSECVPVFMHPVVPIVVALSAEEFAESSHSLAAFPYGAI